MTDQLQAATRAAHALRLDVQREAWLTGGDSRICYERYSRACGSLPAEWTVKLAENGRETITVTKADRLDALAHALQIAMLESEAA
jgi:hypothetical protein